MIFYISKQPTLHSYKIRNFPAGGKNYDQQKFNSESSTIQRF